MSKKIKELELAVLRKTFSGVKDYVILQPLKVDAGTEFEFRKKLRAAKVSVKLVKNSFAKKVLTDLRGRDERLSTCCTTRKLLGWRGKGRNPTPLTIDSEQPTDVRLGELPLSG